MNQSSTYQELIKANKASIILLVTGVVGFIASFTLTIDKIKLLQNPTFVPACSLNPIISCLSAMSSRQSEIWGIPNSLIGVMIYTALIVISLLLFLRVSLPQIVWRGMALFCLLGTLFVHYLIIQSLFSLHTICPWCLSIWLTTPLLFFALMYEYQKHIIPKKPHSFIQATVRYILKQRIFLGAVWYMVLILGIGIIFRDYWATLLS